MMAWWNACSCRPDLLLGWIRSSELMLHLHKELCRFADEQLAASIKKIISIRRLNMLDIPVPKLPYMRVDRQRT
jgi:hypothetical protein